MTIEEIRQEAEAIDTSDIVAGVQNAKDALLMLIEKVEEVDARVRSAEAKVGRLLQEGNAS